MQGHLVRPKAPCIELEAPRWRKRWMSGGKKASNFQRCGGKGQEGPQMHLGYLESGGQIQGWQGKRIPWGLAFGTNKHGEAATNTDPDLFFF